MHVVRRAYVRQLISDLEAFRGVAREQRESSDGTGLTSSMSVGDAAELIRLLGPVRVERGRPVGRVPRRRHDLGLPLGAQPLLERRVRLLAPQAGGARASLAASPRPWARARRAGA